MHDRLRWLLVALLAPCACTGSPSDHPAGNLDAGQRATTTTAQTLGANPNFDCQVTSMTNPSGMDPGGSTFFIDPAGRPTLIGDDFGGNAHFEVFDPNTGTVNPSPGLSTLGPDLRETYACPSGAGRAEHVWNFRIGPGAVTEVRHCEWDSTATDWSCSLFGSFEYSFIPYLPRAVACTPQGGFAVLGDGTAIAVEDPSVVPVQGDSSTYVGGSLGAAPQVRGDAFYHAPSDKLFVVRDGGSSGDDVVAEFDLTNTPVSEAFVSGGPSPSAPFGVMQGSMARDGDEMHIFIGGNVVEDTSNNEEIGSDFTAWLHVGATGQASFNTIDTLPAPRAWYEPLVLDTNPVAFGLAGGVDYVMDLQTFNITKQDPYTGILVWRPGGGGWITVGNLNDYTFWEPTAYDTMGETFWQVAAEDDDGPVETCTDIGIPAEDAGGDGGFTGEDVGACTPSECSGCAEGSGLPAVSESLEKTFPQDDNSVECPVVGGEAGASLTVSGEVSGQTAECPECKAEVSVGASLEGELNLCDISFTLEGSAMYEWSRTHELVCDEAVCKQVCGEEYCEETTFSGDAQLEATKRYGYEKSWGWRTLSVQSNCEATVAGRIQANGSYETSEGDTCMECRTLSGEVGIGSTGTAGCSFEISIAGIGGTIGCEECGRIDVDVAANISDQSGECGDERCYGVSSEVAAQAETPCTPGLEWASYVIVNSYKCTARIEANSSIDTCGNGNFDIDPSFRCRGMAPSACN